MIRRFSSFFRGKRGIFILGIGAALYLLLSSSSSDPRSFQTVEVTRGDLSVSISATGTVEPEEVIDVGAQVAGQIISLGTDTTGKSIDYGSIIEEGSILARIDPSLYETDVAQAEAQVKRARADLLQLQAKLFQAERDWNRAKKLGPSDALSQSAYDSYRAAFESAKASVAVGEAEVTQAEATLSKAQRNLAFCIIKSPVQGVIIDRRVNIGQTVVSSLNAPSLFLIAKDLRKMEIWISVNEADIGKIAQGQEVLFSVDAFPGEEFRGTVKKIRLNASMSQNVVTYIVEVAADNSNGRLLPYLTANARFQVSNFHEVLLVPNSALRFTPSQESKKGDSNVDTTSTGTLEQGIVWKLAEGETLTPVKVLKKGSDGFSTVVESNDLTAGDFIVVSEEVTRQNSDTRSPFTPQMPGGRRMMR